MSEIRGIEIKPVVTENRNKEIEMYFKPHIQ